MQILGACIFLYILGNHTRQSVFGSETSIKACGRMNSDRKTSKVQQEIDENLKRAYGDVTKQEVPDRFTDLLAQLRAADSGNTSNGGDNNVES